MRVQGHRQDAGNEAKSAIIIKEDGQLFIQPRGDHFDGHQQQYMLHHSMEANAYFFSTRTSPQPQATTASEEDGEARFSSTTHFYVLVDESGALEGLPPELGKVSGTLMVGLPVMELEAYFTSFTPGESLKRKRVATPDPDDAAGTHAGGSGGGGDEGSRATKKSRLSSEDAAGG